jgi:hypothetical protein
MRRRWRAGQAGQGRRLSAELVLCAVGTRLIRGAFAGVARRAAGGPPRQEPAADAGPAAPQGAALI